MILATLFISGVTIALPAQAEVRGTEISLGEVATVESVDETLAAAPFLRIYAVTQKTMRCLGMRPLEADSRRHHDGVGDARAFLRALTGCRAVVATSYSSRAVTLLRAVGINPIAANGLVEPILDRVARGTIRQVT